MAKRKLTHRERLQEIKRGHIKPNTSKEWAILYESERKKNEERLRVLHKNAAINKSSFMAGKVVVVKPAVD